MREKMKRIARTNLRRKRSRMKANQPRKKGKRRLMVRFPSKKELSQSFQIDQVSLDKAKSPSTNVSEVSTLTSPERKS
jgi:hypothetical protein